MNVKIKNFKNYNFKFDSIVKIIIILIFKVSINRFLFIHQYSKFFIIIKKINYLIREFI